MGMLNIASLPKHIEEIRVILAEKCQDMFIHNYDLIRADRSRTGRLSQSPFQFFFRGS
jgi:hypothetical protein